MDLLFGNTTSSNIFYRYLGRYFFESEVGTFWAIVNCFVGAFWIGVGMIYLFKPWGLTSFHKNVIKNKRRLRKLAMERLAEELKTDNEALKESRQRILNWSFSELQGNLQKGAITAAEAVDAYRWKALEVQEKYNCVTEFVKEAEGWAKELDEKFAGKEKPALFGLPFSVKDNFFMEGYDSCRGLGKECEWQKTEECSFVSQLRSLGAIPIVRTNIPQLLLAYVCSNPVYGTTKNPHDVEKTPGGSSGGEGVIVATGGCAFGIGSDLLGSLRIPAHFCGIYTMKPTSARCKVTGAHGGVPGSSRLGLSYGFFTRDAKTQTFLWENFLNEGYFRRVPSSVPLPFVHQNGNGGERFPLKIGYFTNDGWMTPVPSCVRAVEESKKILEDLGHQLIPFEVPRPTEAFQTMLKCLLPDNAEYLIESWRYDEVEPLMKAQKNLFTAPIPLCVRGVLSCLLKPVWPRVSAVLGAHVKSVGDLRATYETADEYVKELTHQWKEAGLDAMLCPAFPVPAVPHDVPARLSAVAFATGLWNLLDFPVAVLPVTKVTSDDVKDLMDSYPTVKMAKRGNFNLRYPFYGLARDASKTSEGLPIGVQIATLPYQEELCLQVMQILEDNLEK